ncbi:MAG: diadenosine tetraphosphate hydrolase [Candidatus Hydrothermarchaeota archaeon]|nr:MAG: diadenosine tetraphosphate hydrolase [Candidatus Hydrothermarchaeota archaeon]
MLVEKSAGVIIFRSDEEIKYLLLKYGYGHWDFVKGNIEKGENEIETIIRETKEETGIEDLKFLKGFKEKISYFYRKGKDLVYKEVVFYLAETKEKKVRLSYEHEDYCWLPFEKALEKITFNNSKKLLKKANSYLKNEKEN